MIFDNALHERLSFGSREAFGDALEILWAAKILFGLDLGLEDEGCFSVFIEASVAGKAELLFRRRGLTYEPPTDIVISVRRGGLEPRPPLLFFSLSRDLSNLTITSGKPLPECENLV